MVIWFSRLTRQLQQYRVQSSNCPTLIPKVTSVVMKLIEQWNRNRNSVIYMTLWYDSTSIAHRNNTRPIASFISWPPSAGVGLDLGTVTDTLICLEAMRWDKIYRPLAKVLTLKWRTVDHKKHYGRSWKSAAKYKLLITKYTSGLFSTHTLKTNMTISNYKDQQKHCVAALDALMDSKCCRALNVTK